MGAASPTPEAGDVSTSLEMTTAPSSLSPQQPSPLSAAQLFAQRVRDRARAKVEAERTNKRKAADLATSQVGTLNREAGSDSDDLPDLDPLPGVQRSVRSRRTAGLSHDDSDSTRSRASNGMRKSVRISNAADEKQIAALRDHSLGSKPAEHSGARGKFSFERLKKDKVATQKQAVRRCQLASQMQSILDAQTTADFEEQRLSAVLSNEPSFSPQRRIYSKQAEMETAMSRLPSAEMGEDDTARRAALEAVRADHRDKPDQNGPKRLDELSKRRFWTTQGHLASDGICPPVLPMLPVGASTFHKRIHDACAACLTEGCAFPPDSVPNRPGLVARRLARDVIPWLFELVSHPWTTNHVGDTQLKALVRLLEQAAGTKQERLSNPDPLPLGKKSFEKAFERLGAILSMRSDDVNTDGAITAQSPSPRGASTSFVGANGNAKVGGSHDARRFACANRLLRVCEAIGRINAWRDSLDDFVFLSSLVSRLLVDPAGLRTFESAQRGLDALISAFEDDVAGRKALLSELLNVFLGKSRSIQHRHLLCLPHRTRKERLFRRWLAWHLLLHTTIAKAEEAGVQVDLDQRPPYTPLAKQIQYNLVKSPFHIHRGMDDEVLHETACILQYALTDLRLELQGYSAQARANCAGIRDIIDRLRQVESRITMDIRSDSPTRIRAKNILTTVCHTLMYQLPERATQRNLDDMFFGV